MAGTEFADLPLEKIITETADKTGNTAIFNIAAQTLINWDFAAENLG